MQIRTFRATVRIDGRRIGTPAFREYVSLTLRTQIADRIMEWLPPRLFERPRLDNDVVNHAVDASVSVRLGLMPNNALQVMAAAAAAPALANAPREALATERQAMAAQVVAGVKRKLDEVYFKGWAVTKEDAHRILDEVMLEVCRSTPSASSPEVASVPGRLALEHAARDGVAAVFGNEAITAAELMTPQPGHEERNREIRNRLESLRRLRAEERMRAGIAPQQEPTPRNSVATPSPPVPQGSPQGRQGD